MAKSRVANQGKAGEQPVTSGIHRAGKRIGYEPAGPDRTDEELDTLRALVRAAEKSFHYQGPITTNPTDVLVEALGAASEDFAVISDAEGAGGGVAPSAFRRAELRCQLAIALFEYRSAFGFPEPAGEVVEQEGGAS
ncbi:MAG: hypothetical protein QM756_10525 [Polyangiaceae bacterium]